MQKIRTLSIAVTACLAFGPMLSASAHAAWLLSQLGQGSFGLSRVTGGIADGTSNTIFLGESSRAAICFDDATTTPGGITDGTSNTILFGEDAALRVVPGSILQRAPVQQIADGTSNTIFLGEVTGSFCLGDTEVEDAFVPDITDGTSNTIIVGEQTEFDICFRDVQRNIVDGTSNTIIIGETAPEACYADIRPTRDLVAEIPVPASCALLLVGLAAIGMSRRGPGSTGTEAAAGQIGGA